MATSTEAMFEYKQPLGKHAEMPPLSNKVVEEEAQNAGRSYFYLLASALFAIYTWGNHL